MPYRAWPRPGGLSSSLVAYGVLIFLGMILLGCGGTEVPLTGKYIPPETINDQNENWVRAQSGVDDSDNEKIGEFFEANPELLNSPDWTGQPEKYVSEDSSDQTRYYWFGGSKDAPTWSVVEFNGSRMREFSGQGVPGAN